MALTSGPTNPDYTSFEPVDTSDMVNLFTGDFTYGLPLLEVPGRWELSIVAFISWRNYDKSRGFLGRIGVDIKSWGD